MVVNMAGWRLVQVSAVFSAVRSQQLAEFAAMLAVMEL